MWLLDTNVLSELRKTGRTAPSVERWYRSVDPNELFTSVLVLGEIHRGIVSIRRRDPAGAASLYRWFTRLCKQFEGRALPVTLDIAVSWSHLTVPNPVPVIDGLLAATALEHRLTLVTRNVRDMERTGVAILNPFDD